MKNLINILLIIMLFGVIEVFAQTKPVSLKPPKGKSIAVFAEGCFWCSEHIFEAIVGVDDAVSGYSGGKTNRPTYEEVGREETGHAEAVLIYYDPQKVSYKELVKVFFYSHDPTTPNQQGPDKGSSYRSIAFYQNDEEKLIIEKEISALNQSKRFKNKVVTEVLSLKVFFKAENYHQNYINRHPEDSYVKGVSIPRFELFKKVYKGELKKEK